MSENDTIMQDAENAILSGIRLVQQVGEALRARRALKLQLSQQQMYADQARLNQELGVARPYLSEGLRDHFWNSAHSEDMSHMLGVATRFRDVDPLAEQVYMRALREIENRYGPVEASEPIDVEAISDTELEQSAPSLPGEHVPASEIREAVKEAKEPIPQWVTAWSEDFRNGQAKPVDYYQTKFPDNNEAEAEANRAHLEADLARADQALLEGSGEVDTPELEQAQARTVSAQTREKAAQIRRDQIGVEAAKAVEVKDVSFPEPASEGIKRSGKLTKTRKPKPLGRRYGPSR